MLLPNHLTPSQFAQLLKAYRQIYLCLDIDGTLSSFELDPADSYIPAATLQLLAHLQQLDVPIAIITGRGLADAKRMLGQMNLPIASTHGLEISLNPQTTLTALTHLDAINLESINQQKSQFQQAMRQACQQQAIQGYLIEEKPYSLALHYRQNPALQPFVQSLMQSLADDHPDWQLNHGKYVIEILPKGADKGRAIMTLLQHYATKNPWLSDCCPIFIGDDVTDEAGFLAVQQAAQISNKCKSMMHYAQGIGIKVGKAPSQAQWYVNDIEAVQQLLDGLYTHCQNIYHKNEVTV